MPYLLLYPSLVTLFVYVIDKLQKSVKPSKYVFIFFISLALNLWWERDYLSAEEPKSNYEIRKELEIYLLEQEYPNIFHDPYEMLSENQEKELRKRIKYHTDKGKEYFNLALGICPILPTIDGKRAEEYFEVAI